MFDKMFFVTNHAINRFRSRIEDLSPASAMRCILGSMQAARVVKRTWRNGKIYYCRTRSHDFFPIIYPPDIHKGNWPVITTIITSDTQEGRELLQRAKKLWN